jgi:hypothetical protein
VLYLVYFALQRAYAILQDIVLQDQLAIFGGDMVHLRSMEEVRNNHIEKRHHNKAQQQFSQNVVSLTAL